MYLGQQKVRKKHNTLMGATCLRRRVLLILGLCLKLQQNTKVCVQKKRMKEKKKESTEGLCLKIGQYS